jgi:hypothetical protein
MNDEDRNTLEFIAKEYYDYLFSLLHSGNKELFELEKINATILICKWVTFNQKSGSNFNQNFQT